MKKKKKIKKNKKIEFRLFASENRIYPINYDE